MTFKRNTLASLVLIASGLSLSAHAADSFNINVTGVISPAACEANITGGETIDYGTILANTLTADAITLLPAKQTGFTITCDAPAKLGLRTTDNRAGSKFSDTEEVVIDSGVKWRKSNLNGLGVDSKGNNIGGWSSVVTAFSTDTAASKMIYSDDDGTSWSASNHVNFPIYSLLGMSSRIYTVAATDTLVPAAFSTLSGTLDVQAIINPASTLDLSQPVTLDGSVTVEMVYL